MPSKSPNWIAARSIFDGSRLLPEHAVLVENGRILSLSPTNRLGADVVMRTVDGVVAPGFVDLQVNGGGGVLLNTTPTAEGIAKILEAHRQFGTVALMPTVITDAPEVMEASAQAALDARDLPGMIGLHIEGPHISTARRGTHRTEFIRPFDSHTLRIVERLRAAEIPVMVTVAPESIIPGQVKDLASIGAVVSIGHSDATAEEVVALLDAGASCFTHLYNGMSQMQGRAPGVVGAALGSDAAIGIICDGVHVSDEMVALAFRATPRPDQVFLVSDAMPTVGGPDAFDLYDMTIRVKDGALVNSEGSLAGAHTTMAEGVARLAATIGLTLERALIAAISSPASVVGRPDLASIIGRPIDDLIVIDGSGNTIGQLLTQTAF